MGLIINGVDVVVRLVRLIKLVMASHFSNKSLRRLKQGLDRLVFLQSRLVGVKLPIAGIAPILNELEQGLQMLDLVENLLCSRDPKSAQ